MPIRFVTAASLFDGHDVSINIMRRILQANGVEVIHLGHNRSALEVVNATIQEDAHAVAISSYQGGHNEYFKYVRELLVEKGGENKRIFGGGGGVITPKEIADLQKSGITRIYSPADGMQLSLDGIIQDMIWILFVLRGDILHKDSLRVTVVSKPHKFTSENRSQVHTRYVTPGTTLQTIFERLRRSVEIPEKFHMSYGNN